MCVGEGTRLRNVDGIGRDRVDVVVGSWLGCWASGEGVGWHRVCIGEFAEGTR